MKLSVVTTLYKSSPYIHEFYARVSAEAQKITEDYEVIFVDDGSPDDSLQKVVTLHRQDPRVVVIELSRNFGHHKAIMTGLGHAKGEYVFLIDSDLEEDPELLGVFWQELLNENDLDMVYGVQSKRKGGWFEEWSGNLFYKLFNSLSEVKIPKNFLTVRLMARNYVHNLLRFTEKELVFSVLISLSGFKTKKHYVVKHCHSPTTYSLVKKISLLFNVITSSTARPLWIIFNFGLLITLLSSFYAFVLIYQKLFYDVGIDGWTSVIVSIMFFGGLIIFFLGIIGIYLSKIFNEVKNRPLSITKNIYERNI